MHRLFASHFLRKCNILWALAACIVYAVFWILRIAWSINETWTQNINYASFENKRLFDLPNSHGSAQSSKFWLQIFSTPLTLQVRVLFLRGLFSPFRQQSLEHLDHMLHSSSTASTIEKLRDSVQNHFKYYEESLQYIKHNEKILIYLGKQSKVLRKFGEPIGWFRNHMKFWIVSYTRRLFHCENQIHISLSIHQFQLW